jgi:hypothetical protein
MACGPNVDQTRIRGPERARYHSQLTDTCDVAAQWLAEHEQCTKRRAAMLSTRQQLALSAVGAQVLAGGLEKRLSFFGESSEEVRPLLRIVLGLGLPAPHRLCGKATGVLEQTEHPVGAVDQPGGGVYSSWAAAAGRADPSQHGYCGEGEQDTPGSTVDAGSHGPSRRSRGRSMPEREARAPHDRSGRSISHWPYSSLRGGRASRSAAVRRRDGTWRANGTPGEDDQVYLSY